MRKPILLLASLGLLVALSACTEPAGGQVNGTTTQAPSSSTTTTTTTAKSAAASSSAVTSSATETAVPTTATTANITRDQAIEIALEQAGFMRDAVLDLEAELDRERDGLYWEVSFETPKYEYSYEIHAVTGAVVKEERERND